MKKLAMYISYGSIIYSLKSPFCIENLSNIYTHANNVKVVEMTIRARWTKLKSHFMLKSTEKWTQWHQTQNVDAKWLNSSIMNET